MPSWRETFDACSIMRQPAKVGRSSAALIASPPGSTAEKRTSKPANLPGGVQDATRMTLRLKRPAYQPALSRRPGRRRAGHVMLIDLVRNDLSRVCRPGAVRDGVRRSVVLALAAIACLLAAAPPGPGAARP